MEEEKMAEDAIKILMEKLGPVETGRFIALSRKKTIDSIKRHHLWQSSLNKEAFFNSVFRKR